jgi:hypothetical protein
MTNQPPEGLQPQPVIKAAILAAGTEIIGLLVAFGVPVNDEQRTGIIGALASVATLVGLGLAWRASRKVTPLASPRDNRGRVLLPEPDTSTHR